MAREPVALVGTCGKPASVFSDNGTKFTVKAIPNWANENDVQWNCIDPGKPQQNGYIEFIQRRPARRMPQRRHLRQPRRCTPHAGVMTATTSGRISHRATRPCSRRARRLSNPRAGRACPTRNLPRSNPKSPVMHEGRPGGRSDEPDWLSIHDEFEADQRRSGLEPGATPREQYALQSLAASGMILTDIPFIRVRPHSTTSGSRAPLSPSRSFSTMIAVPLRRLVG